LSLLNKIRREVDDGIRPALLACSSASMRDP
jgi:hypothetical protein